MNYERLFHELRERRIRIALTGANGAFGRTFIAQCRVASQVELAALCDRDVEGLHSTLLRMGWAREELRVCASEADVRTAGGRIALVAEAAWLGAAPQEILVEATGAPEDSVAIAEAALRRRVHVGMVTKETDSVVGPWLNRLALEHGVVYTTVDGDQPAALIELVTWARVLGFEVICAGKASEHDFVHDPEHGVVTHAGVSRVVPGLEHLWACGTDMGSTLEARRRALHAFPQSATPDYCEMNVVANSTALLPSCDELNYPLCRTSELADVFVPVADGGVLTRTGVVDVFNALRRRDEASFGGGVFVIVRCTDRPVWELLREKGHVVGRSGRYACIYRPFHLMGLESLNSVYSAVLHGRSSGSPSQRPHALMVARATRDLRAGATLAMGGHMHEIDGVAARLVPARQAQGAAPYYLAADKRLLRDVPCGTHIPVSALALGGSALARAWSAMQSLATS